MYSFPNFSTTTWYTNLLPLLNPFPTKPQESYYNLGRAMHQLGLLSAALHYYKQALSLPPVLKEEENEKEDKDKDASDIFDLQREIAFNLALIYQGSDSHDMARMYIQKHIVV